MYEKISRKCIVENIKLNPNFDFNTTKNYNHIYIQIQMINIFLADKYFGVYSIEPEEECIKFYNRCRELIETNTECKKCYDDFVLNYVYSN